MGDGQASVVLAAILQHGAAIKESGGLYQNPGAACRGW